MSARVARLGIGPALTAAEVVPAWRPAAVYEPRISASQAAERLGRFRGEVAALLDRTPTVAKGAGTPGA